MTGIMEVNTMNQSIYIERISIKNFKSLYDVSFEPGNINVFIGANGSGKTSVLEAIGILSAAISDRVNNNALQRKGIRLSTSALYKSKFASLKMEGATVDFNISWRKDGKAYNYSTYLAVPKEDDNWKYFAETVARDGEKIFGRSNRSAVQTNNKVGYFALAVQLETDEFRAFLKYIENYGIYQPDTLTLRGSIPDLIQANPVGLNGGRFAEAMSDLFSVDDGDLMFGTMYIEDVLELLDWASEFRIGKPKKSILNPGVPSTQQIVEFKDKYLKDTASFTGYDASEGALYVLFMITLAMHEQSPKMFSIDSFDHALNPRLARKVTEIFCKKVIEANKTVFMTTHNPLVLDGLDLTDDRIRLFTTDRNKNGLVEVKRVKVSDELIKMNQPLSRLWINGLIEGVPELI